MASKANSGNILDLTARVQRNRFEDKVVKVGDVEIVFAGFISSRKGSEFNQALSEGRIAEAFELVMKTPDKAQAEAFKEAILDEVPVGDDATMEALYAHILGRGESDPNP